MPHLSKFITKPCRNSKTKTVSKTKKIYYVILFMLFRKILCFHVIWLCSSMHKCADIVFNFSTLRAMGRSRQLEEMATGVVQGVVSPSTLQPTKHTQGHSMPMEVSVRMAVSTGTAVLELFSSSTPVRQLNIFIYDFNKSFMEAMSKENIDNLEII